ncbi:nucleoid DNA-binding protein [Mesomycoplasma conjunctivae]|uniref:Bacterial nucleoid DNA-binding protein n=1 Tax=Mesomycoplasma conjunctivae (strain ATCC 25834 / NCTC 10147 / HRC/581) TaxID=572263 RepID=C5J632_MESCH|nr:HU family DNA-binding protein [Mesomycoplasma conjunctivae]CAT04924.1 Bacterial nucleoid DNA-binding protein [Mesomycoplasma conjunctivae]VEU66057.1 nucleoid DNA-binding protein [Mesomycoplasma conjunctivae]
MNKKELIEIISAKTEMSQKNVEIILSSFFEEVAHVMKKQDKLVINSFGTFQGIYKEASVSINPLTKSEIRTPAKTVAKFKPSKNLKEFVA